MRSSSTGRWAELYLFAAILAGAAVRFGPTLLAHGVINDGGMFDAMIRDLIANRFLIPAYTTYNNLHLPFAYPPLSLYAGALLAATGIPVEAVLRWLPPLISSASVPAFYWMGTQMLGSRSKAALGAVAYALMPRSFSWYVMGGGLSRSFGVLFLLLTAGSAWLLFTTHDRRRLVLTAVFGAAAVLSHPETALHAAIVCALIWVFRGRDKTGTRDAALVAAGVLLLTSPWWGTVLAHNGWAPFASAMHTGAHTGTFWLPWITMGFAEETFATLLTVLGLLGLVVQCVRREWFLPVWLLLPFAVEPRSATAVAALPLSLLAGCGLADLVIPRIVALGSGWSEAATDWTSYMSDSGAVRAVTGYVLLFALFGAFSYDLSLSNYIVPQPTRQAMQWVQAHAPSDARFLVLTGHTDPFSDPSTEWFPVLAGRTSMNTIQGQEWMLGPRFKPFLDDATQLQSCLNSSPACLDEWASAQGLQYDYIFLESPDRSAGITSGLLLYQLMRDAHFSLVYQNEGAVVFARK